MAEAKPAPKSKGVLGPLLARKKKDPKDFLNTNSADWDPKKLAQVRKGMANVRAILAKSEKKRKK